MITKPEQRAGTFYFSYYIGLPPQKYLIEALKACVEEIEVMCSEMLPENGSFRYASEKWSLKQLLNHVIDTERIFATRALHFSRNDATPLPGFDEDNFAKNDNSDNLTITSLLEEYKAVRKATQLFYQNISETSLEKTGYANGTKMSVRELGWTIAGHDLHHIKIIRERYLPCL